MKTIPFATVAFAALTLTVLRAPAQTTYTATGHANGSATDGTEISSVVVGNTASTITFTINSSQTMDQYIFYAVDIQVIGEAANGYTPLSNPIWSGSPALGISTGENAVLDFNNTGNSNTGAVAFNYNGASWSSGVTVSYDAGGAGNNFATATVPLSSLGLSLGQSFYFDVVSTYTSWSGGGPQSAYGALDSISGYPAETDSSYQPWNGDNAYDSATDASGTTFGTAASEFTVTVAPEPSVYAILGLGLLVFSTSRTQQSRDH